MSKHNLKKSNKLITRGILIMLSLIMLLGVVPVPINATELDKAREEKTSLEQKKKDIKSQIAALEREKTNIINYIEQLDAQLNSLTEEMNILKADIENAEEELEVAREELKEAKETEENQYDCMKKRIKYIYENGEPSFLELFVESKSISEFLNQVEIRSKITKYDNSLLDKYMEITTEVEEKEKDIEVRIDDLNYMYEELKIEQDAVEVLVQEKANELAKREEEVIAAEIVSEEYETELAEKLKEIEHLEEEERRRAEEELRRKQEEERKRREEEERKKLEDARRKAQEAAANVSTDTSSGGGSQEVSTGSGVLTWPIPSGGRVSSEFNPNRLHPIYNYRRPHNGIDIAIGYGNSIVAADSGTVIGTGYNSGSGNYVNISHGNGMVTKYFHCASIAVNSGDKVQKGQTIAYVGSTGASTGPHLHFEVIINGVAKNPRNYL